MDHKINTITDDKDNLLEVKGLIKYYPVQTGLVKRVSNWIRAVDDVSFNIRKGETLGLVGESGCGKSTIGQTIIRLIEPTKGKVYFTGKSIFELSGSEFKKMRRSMQIIFQDPISSLDPRMKIGEIVGEGLDIHKIGSRKERNDTVINTLKTVGLEDYHAKRYPHEFSGGQRQRIGIARALVLNPDFIICDEPVSALDVSIQSQVLNLLSDLQRKFQITYLFIAHNLSVVEHISHRVAVMYLGKMAEMATSEDLFSNPLHPYTQALISAIPSPNLRDKKERTILRGDLPSPLNPPSGCRFHSRCPIATEHCTQEEPPLIELRNRHWVACWRAN